MKKMNILQSLLLCAALVGCANEEGHQYNGSYTGKELDHIAYPIGGLGSGMFCLEGTGAISNLSLHHYPELFNEPCTFAAIHIDGLENGSKVLEAGVPDYKKFGRLEGGMGSAGRTWGLPRFDHGTFSARFPFAHIDLQDDDIPMAVSIEAWNPFIPNDEDNSGLPVAGFEYTFKNTSSKTQSATFSFNTRNFMERTDESEATITKMDRGFILNQEACKTKPEEEGHFAVFTDEESAAINYCWFRGGWFDPLSIAWRDVENGTIAENEPGKGGPGASLFVPFELKPGESKTIRLYMSWYVPFSDHKIGSEPENKSDYGNYYNPELYKDMPECYEPWYSRRFASVNAVADYWKQNYTALKERTQLFTESLYDSTLPDEVMEAITSNLTILKSSTIMRQHDGRFWVWEGSGDNWGSCEGSCTHVWNYAQAVPHLFPRMEKTLRETEFLVDQNCEGHQFFRASLPIRPAHHDFHSASDGQLGGIMKIYRDWRINGDTDWLRSMWPAVHESMDYCIRTWDPRKVGAVEEPHHNTYDIEFWGADGMITSFYAGALNSFIHMGKALGEDMSEYETLLSKSRSYLTDKLWNGEYFYQKVQWTGLNAPNPVEVQSFGGDYSEEARAILEKEGPKYQYGTGCLSDGVLGFWMSLVSGLEEPMDKEHVVSHLNSVYKYNLKHDLFDHADPQRPGYALGHEGGLLLCTWPHGGKLSLPFVYSNEVWTGIEYQVASHLIFEGEIEKGLDIIRTCRDRYNTGLRNPYNEYECGSWYARALSSYSLFQAFTGVRYDAVEKTLYIDSRVGDFKSFISTASGYGNVGLKNGEPYLEVKEGTIDVQTCIVSGKETTLR